MQQISAGVWVIAGLMVLCVIFLMSMFAKLFRKAGPHEALVVYGFRGTRIVKGRGTVIFPMIENCPRPLAGVNVVRRSSAARPLHQAGRSGHGRSRSADQGDRLVPAAVVADCDEGWNDQRSADEHPYVNKVRLEQLPWHGDICHSEAGRYPSSRR